MEQGMIRLQGRQRDNNNSSIFLRKKQKNIIHFHDKVECGSVIIHYALFSLSEEIMKFPAVIRVCASVCMVFYAVDSMD